jgi:DNA-binding HxlR family transcriptional regulator
MKLESTTSSPAETRAEITRLSSRGYTQLRHVLVQLPDRNKDRASTLARMLHERKHRALLLYIMLLTCWPWLQDRREPLEGAVWMRALTADGAPTWSASTLSRTWRELVDMGLVVKPDKREGRSIRPAPRREDGGADYENPAGRRDRWNAYFALPDNFWTDELFAKLTLPALVMLLLVAKETNGKDEVWLTYENAEEWYGIKPKSAQNGLTELRELGILHRRVEKIKAPLIGRGETVRMYYSLTGNYGHQSRAALQKRATRERHRRLKREARAAAASQDRP